MKQLVALSERALSDDLSELDDAYNAIEDWNMNRSKIITSRHSGRVTTSFGEILVTQRKRSTENLEQRLMKHRLSIQHYLLQRQNKTKQIVDLILGEYKSLEKVPEYYRHHLAAAYARSGDIESAIEVLSLFDVNDKKTPQATIPMLAMAYVANSQSDRALELISSRSNLFGETASLLQLKYAVLAETGEAEAIANVQQKLALLDIKPRKFKRGTASIAWSPILDHI